MKSSVMKSIAQRRQSLRERFPVWVPRTLDQWLDACAAEYGQRPLVITDEVTLTYADVARQSRQLADARARRRIRRATGPVSWGPIPGTAL